MFSPRFHGLGLNQAVSALIFVCLFTTAYAADPVGSISYQGYLATSDGAPVDDALEMTFAAYNVEDGGAPLWDQTQEVLVQQGLFNAALANPENPFPQDLFDGPVFIGLFIEGEELMPRRPLAFAGFAYRAVDAQTLEGNRAGDLDQSGDVANLESEVSTAQGDIASLAGDVSTNDGRIAALEGSAGDITAVSAGAGLVGGGVAGNVALAIGGNAVTSGMIATGAVTASDISAGAVSSGAIADNSILSSDIQNGTINPEDVNANASLPFEVRGLVVGDWGFRVDSNADAFFLGSPAVRWFNSAGTTQHGSLSVTSSQMVMQHVGQNNAIFRSSSNGVGLAGSFAQPGYAATIPSLLVENSIDIGYERVEVAFALDIAVTSCASHGGQTCWVGTAFATCPAGKSVLGGGTNGSSSAAGNVVRSGPSGNSSWACTMTHNQPGIARICTAICARIQ